MEYKKFEINLITQIILIIVVSLLIAFSTQKENLQFTTFYFIAILIGQGFILYYYVQRKNQKIIHYLKNITLKDAEDRLVNTSYNLNEELIKNISNNLSSKYKSLEKEKLFNEYYLSYLLESVNVGVLAINDKNIEFHNSFINTIFKQNIQNIKHINQLHISLENILQKVTLDNSLVHIFNIKGENIPISISLTHFKIKDKEIKLYTFYNVKSELQEKEMKTWQEVIRVISHEIMNSISPIKSLSSTIYETLSDELKNENIDKIQLENILEGIQAIEKRSSNLTDFVTNYKKLTKIPQPVIKEIKLNNLFGRIKKLLINEIELQDIQFDIVIEPISMSINADESLLEQIIINLITNSIHALKNVQDKRIVLKAFYYDNKSCITITDNGFGIEENEMDKIFLPFYTNKENGSGIGLSLAQQIIHLHGGNISVQSEQNSNTTFTLSF